MKKKVVVLLVVVSLLISSFSVCNLKTSGEAITDSSLFASSGSGIQVPFEGDGADPEPEMPGMGDFILLSSGASGNNNL